MAVSVKQQPANKRNAAKSRGPKSPQGKAKASANAMKFGIFSGKLLLPGERLEDYNNILHGLQADFAPVGFTENYLVERIAVLIHKSRRVLSAERASISLQQQDRIIFKTVNQILGSKESETDPFENSDYEWAKEMKAEYDSIPDDVDLTVEYLRGFPAIWSQAEYEMVGLDFQSAEEFLQVIENEYSGLSEWLNDTLETAEREIRKGQKTEKLISCTRDGQSLLPNDEAESFERLQTSQDNRILRAISELIEFQNRRKNNS